MYNRLCLICIFWKIGPAGNLGVVMSVLTSVRSRSSQYYKKMMAKIKSLGHVTVEVTYADDDEVWHLGVV